MIKVKIDLHIHSNHSDGKFSIPEIVDLYGRAGYGVIAITDHVVEHRTLLGKIALNLSYSVSPRAFQSYYDEVCFEGERALREYGMKVIFGYEVSKNSLVNQRSAHILVLGTENLIDPHLPVEEILQEARLHKAFTIAAHPFRTDEIEFQTYHLWSNRKTLAPWIDAWEGSYRKKLVTEVMNSGLPLVASSDFHNLRHSEAWRTALSVSPNKKHDEAEIFRAIREQRLEFFYETELEQAGALTQELFPVKKAVTRL
jgi:hypothetical protein